MRPDKLPRPMGGYGHNDQEHRFVRRSDAAWSAPSKAPIRARLEFLLGDYSIIPASEASFLARPAACARASASLSLISFMIVA